MISQLGVVHQCLLLFAQINRVYPREGVHHSDDKRKTAVSSGTAMKEGSGGGGDGDSSMTFCQAVKCSTNLSDAKNYNRRHNVREHHDKAKVVVEESSRDFASTAAGFGILFMFGFHQEIFQSFQFYFMLNLMWTGFGSSCKMGDVVVARKMFDEIGGENVVSWNPLLAGYVKFGYNGAVCV